MCNLNNIIESEKHLEEYNDYMNFIFKHIVSENKDKYKRLIKEEDIELGHIRKFTTGVFGDDAYEGADFEGAERWFFNYKIINRGKYLNNGDADGNILGTTNQIGFNEWKLLLIKENREEKLKLLGI